MDAPTETLDVSGNVISTPTETLDVSSNLVMDMSGNMVPASNIEPPKPDILTLDDLLNDQSIIESKEQADKMLLETIYSRTTSSLRPTLVEWILKGKPSGFPILTLDIQAPSRCSDGESRDLGSYVQFCSGKTIDEHIALLQAKLPDISLSFANIQGKVSVIVI